jgi:hypothetical protein
MKTVAHLLASQRLATIHPVEAVQLRFLGKATRPAMIADRLKTR